MKLLCALVLISTALALANKLYVGHSVIRVTPETAAKLDSLVYLLKINKHVVADIWKFPSSPGRPVDIQLAPDTAQTFIQELKNAGLSHKIMIPNLQREIEKQKNDHDLHRQRTISKRFDYETYHTLEEIDAHLTEIAYEHDEVTYTVIGQSLYGQDIKRLYIGNGEKPVISFDCTLHAREWISPAACVYMIDQLVIYDPDNPLREAYDWVFIPVLNVDGYDYSWNADRLWRKNLAYYDPETGCMGVDLNRNYDADFGGEGASSDLCDITYHGPSVFSEPETAAHRDMLTGLNTEIIAHFSVHSYGQLWMSPYGYTSDLPPEYDQMMFVADTGVEALTALYGTEYRTGSSYHTIGYQTSGGNRDWVYDTLGVVYSYVLELRDQGEYGFLLPEEQILPTSVELWAGIQAAVSAITDAGK